MSNVRRYLTLSALSACLTLSASAVAGPLPAVPGITEIDVSITGATFDSFTNSFNISGKPTTGVTVFFDNATSTHFSTTFFQLDTGGLDATISADGLSASWIKSTGVGGVVLRDTTNLLFPDNLLIGELVSLDLRIINSSLGAFEGTGVFDVLGGDFSAPFGANGGLATIGLSFTVPQSFLSPFSALANTTLFPETAVPEPTSLILLGVGVMGLGAVGLRRKRKTRGTSS